MQSAAQTGVKTLLLLALTAALTLAVACGDDDDAATPSPTRTPSPTTPRATAMTLQAYFGELDAIFEQSDVASAAARAELDAGLASPADLEAEVAVVDTFLDDLITTFDDAIDGIEGLQAPAAANQSAAAFVTAAEQARDLAAGLKTDLAGATTREEVDQLISDFNSESDVLVARGDDACLALQLIADDNGIDVDLGCQD